MTLRPLTFDFPAMTPPIAGDRGGPLRLSIRPPHAIPEDERLLELAMERDRRRTAYPRLVAAGRLDEGEARRHAAVWDAIVHDATDAPPGLSPAASVAFYEAKHAAREASPWRWEDKVRELRRELALRRNSYPRMIAAGRVDEAEARTRIERLEGVHWQYWILLKWWEAPDPGVPRGHRDYYRHVRAAAAAIDDWLLAAHAAGDPAVAGYLTHEALRWLKPREKAA